jgi:pyruvate/2-oxoglutarate dehydrogenase complex dihydrolipoamide acyltransferase (E2) component
MTSSEASSSEQPSSSQAPAPVPKRITNAQTVCNEKNAKGKLCNGHLKQLRTAGEAAEVHLRGDDVLSKCQTCGTYYMGPPLGHVRDPNKQVRFVEAELTALLQAAGGTLPVVKKDARGVFVMETTSHAPAAAAPPSAPASAAQPPAAKAATPAAAVAKPASAPTQKPATPKPAGQPDRTLMKRSTYAGVADTGPVAGETFEEKVARLRAVAVAAKKRAEEGGEPTAPTGAVPPDAPVVASVLESAMTPTAVEAPAPAVAPTSAPSAPAATSEHKPTGQADRTLMLRSTYCGVVDTGPVPGQTFAQKVERLRALAAAAKQRADGG